MIEIITGTIPQITTREFSQIVDKLFETGTSERQYEAMLDDIKRNWNIPAEAVRTRIFHSRGQYKYTWTWYVTTFE